MALIINGTTIPTNVANALTYNGINITSVIYNGVTYWQQSLAVPQWSGSSTCTGYGTCGLNTSGNLVRPVVNSNVYGSWVSIDSSGIFSTTYTRAFVDNLADINFNSLNNYLMKSSVSYAIGSGFSGSWLQQVYAYVNGTPQYYYNNVVTSGGLLQFKLTGAYTSTGSWISLN